MSDTTCLPIDIHCSKLVEWLQSRRHCGQEWQKSALNIRTKISSAMQDMPEHPEILEMLSGAYINYFHCVRIAEILKLTDSKSKNIFGRYSSHRVNDWLEILNFYEKDCVYLAESAQLLHQYTQYEIPALKKQLARCQIIEQESERKEVDYEKQSRDCEKAYKKECQKMGLAGENLKLELINLSDNLTTFFDEILHDVENLSPPVKFFDEFRRFTLGFNNQKFLDEKSALISMKFLTNKGNVTSFEWKRGFAPDSVERISTKASSTSEIDTRNDIIDFGDDSDFGIDSVATETKFDGLGIEEVGSGQEEVCGENGQGERETKDNVARLDEALTILENTEFIKLLDCDLKELRAFLSIRLLEISRQTGNSDAYCLLDTNLNESPEKISSFLDHSNNLVKKLNDERTKNLLKLRTSPVYVQKICDKLSEPKKLAAKFLQLKSVARQRALESCQKSLEIQIQIDLLVKKSKELQKLVESDISKKYQNRPVNIIGSTAVVKN